MIQKSNKIIKRNILLNPGPATTTISVKEAMLHPDMCPREAVVGELLLTLADYSLDVVNGQDDYESIFLSCSGTGATEACLSSCVTNEQTVLILENGVYSKRMVEICQALNINYDVLSFDIMKPIDTDVLDKYLADNNDKYKIIAFVHHETSTGLLNDLSAINKIAKKYNARTMVDAMSSYAGINIDLMKDSVDYLIASSNKCIHAMAGVGIVIISKAELERISDIKSNNYYFNLAANHKHQKNNKQFLFTPPLQILHSLRQAFIELKSEGGVSARNEKYELLYNHITYSLKELGFNPLISEQYHSKLLTAFNAPDNESYSFNQMHDYLFNNNIIIYPGVINGTENFRIANMGDLCEDDINYFLDHFKDYITKFLN